MKASDRVSAWLSCAIEFGAFPGASATVATRDSELLRIELPPAPADGRLDLEDSISRFVSVPADKASITILDLLRHTGGFESHYDLAAEFARATATGLASDHGRRPPDPLDVILSRPLSCCPGADVVYSCIGFILLGEILERAAGERMDVLARRLVFEPLALEATGYLPENWVRATDTVRPTERDPQTGVFIRGIVHDENARFLGGVSGNAGLGDGAFGHTGFTGTSLFVSPAHGLSFVLLTNRVHFGRDLAVMPRYRSEFHETALGAVTALGVASHATQEGEP